MKIMYTCILALISASSNEFQSFTLSISNIGPKVRLRVNIESNEYKASILSIPSKCNASAWSSFLSSYRRCISLMTGMARQSTKSIERGPTQPRRVRDPRYMTSSQYLRLGGDRGDWFRLLCTVPTSRATIAGERQSQSFRFALPPPFKDKNAHNAGMWMRGGA